MSAGVAVTPPVGRRADPALVGALACLLVLAALFLAPRPVLGAAPPPSTLLIADLRGHALVVASTADPSGVLRIPLPGGPHEMVALPDGRVAVSLEQYRAIALVDPRTGHVESLDVGGTPHGLAVAGDTLYVTDRSVSAVRRFALGTWEERTPVPAGAWPHIVEPRPDGSLAIANAADDTVTLGERSASVSQVPESIAVAPDGSVATAGSIGGTLHIFDAAGKPLARYDIGGRPVRLQYDPSGRVLAASLSADGTVALVERGVVRRVAVGGVPDGLAFSADGRWLYAGDLFGGTVTIVDVARSRVVQRFAAGQSAGALMVLPPAR
ncbi:MAG: YncE family protein [Dehalococcoidia bacterium]